MSETPSSSSTRKRGGNVTTNACTECRKKRSKCDGQVPCSRCTTQGVSCVYEIPVRQTKDAMRTEMEELKLHNLQADHVLAAIAGDDTGEVLQHLRKEPLHDVYQWLQTRESAPGIGHGFNTQFHSDKAREAIQSAFDKVSSIVPSVDTGSRHGSGSGNGEEGMASKLSAALRLQGQGVSEQSSYRSSASNSTSPQMDGLIYGWNRSPSSGSIQTARDAGQQALLGAGYTEQADMMDYESTTATWTNLTPDNLLVKHLMTLYFCWEYPTFASLSKDHFLTDFREHKTSYCSSLLVNAMLALGCRFSELPSTRSDPDDPTTAGDHFFAEAKRLLKIEQKLGSLPSIQALGLMAIREGSCGRDTESFYYAGMAIRMAVEMGLHTETYIPDPAEREVRRATFWGAFTLDQAWSVSLSKLPHLSIRPSFPYKPSIEASSEQAAWIPYTDAGHPSNQELTQPCNVHSVYKCFCELSQLIHDSLYTLYSPERRFTSQDLVRHYGTYLSWYDKMPDVLRMGKNFTPSVLFVHIYYNWACIALFFPFLNLRLRNSRFIPSSIIASSATAITDILGIYDRMYTLRSTPSMTPYLVMISTIATLKCQGVGKEAAKNKQQFEKSVAALHAMAKCHGFATRALEIVKFLAGEWGIDIDATEEDEDGEARRRRLKSKGVQAKADSTNLFVPSGGVWDAEEEGSASPLFNVFPMQGMPLVNAGQLESDGFLRRDQVPEGEMDGECGSDEDM